jgi:hypothetical protein
MMPALFLRNGDESSSHPFLAASSGEGAARDISGRYPEVIT